MIMGPPEGSILIAQMVIKLGLNTTKIKYLTGTYFQVMSSVNLRSGSVLFSLNVGVGVKMAYPQIKLATTLNDAFGS